MWLLVVWCILLLCISYKQQVQADPGPVAPAVETTNAVLDAINDENEELQENESYGYGYYSQPFYRQYALYQGPYYGGVNTWGTGPGSFSIGNAMLWYNETYFMSY